jgi:hypothetical protein
MTSAINIKSGTEVRVKLLEAAQATLAIAATAPGLMKIAMPKRLVRPMAKPIGIPTIRPPIRITRIKRL